MRYIFLFLFSAFSFSTAVAAAQKSKDLSVTSVINLYGVTFQHGSPPWLEGMTDAQDF